MGNGIIFDFSIVSISCGSSSRDNNTYLRLGPISSFDSSNENCNYKICQTNNKVCRIRLDFNTFSIQGPELGTTLATAATTANTDGKENHTNYWISKDINRRTSHSLNFVSASSVGDCNGDSFRATSPQLGGTPIICGFNTGQHGTKMKLDSLQFRQKH